tara:strand:+ start:7322 stop:7552 length:231 start_codon:yes stop_codon:yes gene_type:complete
VVPLASRLVELPRHEGLGENASQQGRDLVRIARHDRGFAGEQGIQSDPRDGRWGSAVLLVAAFGWNPEASSKPVSM